MIPKIKSPFKDKAGVNLYDGDRIIVNGETYRLHSGGTSCREYRWRLLGVSEKSKWLSAKENCRLGTKTGSFVEEMLETIPQGVYCNGCIFLRGSDHGVVYCDYLREGSLDNKKDAFEKALDYYGSEEKVEKATPLSLLWDGCKECGLNEEEIL